MAYKDKERKKQYSRDYYQKNKDKILQQEKQRRRDLKEYDFQSLRLKTTKHSAKRRNLEFNLDKEDIIVPEFCPILGIKLNPHQEGGFHDNSPNLDRIDNMKGYVKGNVRVISRKANSHKGDLTIEQVEKLLAYMKGAL